MGNLVNACIILISMAIFGQTGPATVVQTYPGSNLSTKTLDPTSSKHILSLTYGIGAIVALAMVCYRLIFLKESEVRAWDSLALPVHIVHLGRQL